jgi:DnaJ homolog subfamily C member 17
MSPFGTIDTDSVALTIKPPKFASAAVTFKQIGDAFAAVCASGRKIDGLDGIEVGWLGGKEPEIIGWLKKMGKLGAPPPKKQDNFNGEKGQTAELPQNQQTASGAGGFSSFPETFVSLLSF